MVLCLNRRVTSDVSPAGPAIVSPTPVLPVSQKPTFLPVPSLSPPTSASLTPDYYDSPPSPPRSLADQVHVAYALDDIHLAKVLLLKLKGIEVTSDDDPRIAAVQDEDFDFCFVPHGKLMDEADEKALLERQRKEMEKLEEKRRAERLRACERIWEQEKRRLREARALALRRKEAEEKRKAEDDKSRAEEATRIRIAKEKEAAAEAERAGERRARLSRPVVATPTRNVVSYDTLARSRAESSHASSSPSSSTATSSVISRVDEPFVYDFMVTPRRTPPIRSRPVSLSLSSKSLSSQTLSQPAVQAFARPTYDESRCIPFADVLASMQGPLFPVERRETSSSHSKSKSSKRRTSELLDCLLKVVEWDEDERKQRKGKAVDRPPVHRRGSDKSVLQSPCAACSSPVSPAVSSVSTSSSWLSSPASSRRSWLSFGSTSSSISTVATTPSTSPIPNWLSKPLSTSPLPLTAPTTRPRPISLLLPPRSVTQPEPHSCKSHSHLTPVPIEDGPLPIPGKRVSNLSSSGTSRSRPRGSSKKERSTTPPGERVMRRVSQFVELAKGFQSAYMKAALFSVSASSDTFEDRDIHAAFIVSVSEGWQVRGGAPQASLRRLKPAGCRASTADVSTFLDSPSIIESTSQFVLAPPIPLRSRRNPSTDPPRTILPDPLPYPIVFKPLPIPCRSPFRLHLTQHTPPHTHTYNPTRAPWAPDRRSGTSGHESTVTWRVRTVENPVFLRLKALHNIMWDRGTNWQGRAREGSLGAGKEKMLKVVFEGIGRSCLGADDWQEASCY